MRRHLFAISGTLALAALACNLPGSPVVEPQITLPPVLVITDTPAVPPPTPVQPSEVDLEFIQLTAPGPLSRVTSPVVVTGFSLPTFEQNVVAQVTDMNGDILSLQPATLQSEMGEAGPFETTLNFNVNEEQPGRISVYYASPRDGGLVHLASVPVTLLPPGAETQIEPAAPEDETIQIDFPSPLAPISGGLLTFNGYSQYFFEANLGVVLCGPGGSGAPDPICGTVDNRLATHFVMIQSEEMGLPGPFAGEIAYSVGAETPARLVIFAASPMDGGIEHLTSVEVVLLP
ncbi:MAG: Gmad2 immunoglobulin-like domain-containing protein [Chloroflexi bacterium]|nr:Gmad2 immunoglobulin-like domain-containing protein [Chloroflexota bacterium]